MFHALFESIHPDKATREYVYTLFSTYVAGHNKEEKLHLFTGVGSNGKSLTFDIMKRSFGDYFMAITITLLTRKRGQAENASHVKAMIKGKRLGVLNEPEDGETISVGLMKELTGNDTYLARKLHKDPIEIKPQIKFAIPCNILPAVPSRDNGTWRRLRNINHLTEFVDVPSKPNHRKINRNLKESLDMMIPQVIAFLIHRYITVYKKHGLKEPESVLLATQAYAKENDCLQEFADEKLEHTNDNTDRISKTVLWEEFKAWFRLVHENAKRPGRTELFNYLNRKYGDCTPKGWSGVRFAIGEEGEEDDVEV
jgi:P4 family phage/plasmid primase-like protien